MRNKNEIETELKLVAAQRKDWEQLQNEGAKDGYNPYDAKIEALAKELSDLDKATGPLSTPEKIKAEAEWAKSQNWTRADLQKANKACLERGYSLADLQAAVK